MKVIRNNNFIISTLIITFLLCVTTAHGVLQNMKSGVRTIVIDAGHGGKDPGTVRGQYREKDINLNVALILGQMIRDNYPDVKVIFTRDKDEYIELAERGNIANRASADLFLSVHVDAVKSSGPSGSSTYVMGMDKSNANLDVAMRENDVITYEQDYTTKYEGYVPGSAESFIIFSLMQYAYLNQSMSFAQIIQRHYQLNTPIANRGARQAPYLVLWKTAMPSVLTEMGFLSNDNDRKFVTSSKGQTAIARSLFNAFSEYKSKIDGKNKPIYLSDYNNDSSQSLGQSSDSTQEDTTRSKPAKEITPAPIPQREQERVPSNTTQSQTTSTSTDGVFYAAQICSASSRISMSASPLKHFPGEVYEIKVGTLYKYYIGKCDTYQQVTQLLQRVRKLAPGAFPVGINHGTPISAAEARKLLAN